MQNETIHVKGVKFPLEMGVKKARARKAKCALSHAAAATAAPFKLLQQHPSPAQKELDPSRASPSAPIPRAVFWINPAPRAQRV